MKIQDYMETGKLYSFWDDAKENKFNVGFLLEADDAFSLFNCVTTTGAENGLYLTRTEDIYRIDSEDNYTKRIAKLFCIQKEIPQKWDRSVDSVLVGFLDYVKIHQKMIAVKTDDGDTVMGYLLDYDTEYEEETISVRRVSDDGDEDGFSVIRLDCIYRFSSDSYNERALELLYRSKNKSTS